jgi:hypothetical protein
MVQKLHGWVNEGSLACPACMALFTNSAADSRSQEGWTRPHAYTSAKHGHAVKTVISLLTWVAFLLSVLYTKVPILKAVLYGNVYSTQMIGRKHARMQYIYRKIRNTAYNIYTRQWSFIEWIKVMLSPGHFRWIPWQLKLFDVNNIYISIWGPWTADDSKLFIPPCMVFYIPD